MSYRPVCDFWFLARAKYKGGKKRYGAYLGGFVERARVLLGADISEPVLHVCGGMADLYPYKGGYGPNDARLDMDPAVNPEFLQDARKPYPLVNAQGLRWRAILMDPPYSEVDARQYSPGEENYPTPNQLMKNALDALPVGGRVGLIHYALPAQPKNAKFIAVAAICVGFNNRCRVFSVFQKTGERIADASAKAS